MRDDALDWTTGPLADGLRLYAAADYFAAHEAWEFVWLAAAGPEKSLVQALIQIAAAFHPLQRDNDRGAARVLAAALGRLEPFPARFGGICVDSLRAQLRDRLALLRDGDTRPAAVRIATY